MKIFIITLILIIVSPLYSRASSAQLTQKQIHSLHSYNNRTIIKLHKKQKLYNLANVDQDGLEKIVEELTAEKIIRYSLKRKNKSLYYQVQTKSHKLKVNALDGILLY